MPRQVELHVVAQVVEAELVVGAVGDVAGVGGLALLVVEVVLDDADRQAEEAVDAAHPLGVAAGQVVVDGDDVDALACERVQVGGQRGHERLALAGLHLGDLAVVQHHAADELHVVVPHVEHAAAGLAHHGEGLGQQLVERLAAGRRAARSAAVSVAQLGVGEAAHRGLELADVHDERAQPLQLAIVLGAEDLGEEVTDHAGLARARRFRRSYRWRQTASRKADGAAAGAQAAAQLPLAGALQQELQRIEQPVVDAHFVVQVRRRWRGRWRRPRRCRSPRFTVPPARDVERDRWP